MYPNLAFLKIRQYIKDKKLTEIDMSVYFLVLDQYNLVASICKKEKKPIKNVSVSIKSIAEGLGRSKTTATNRLKALQEVGLISRIEAENPVNGNKNTRPLIYIDKNEVVDYSEEYIPLNIDNKNTPIKVAADLKTTAAADYDDGVPF
jgi:predicted transcriptional regulator